MKKSYKIVLVLMSIFLVLGGLFAYFINVGENHIFNRAYIVSEVLRTYPNVKYLGKEKGDDGIITYRFANDDFDFVLTNDESNSSIHQGSNHYLLHSTYLYEMLSFLKVDIEDLCEKYEIELDEKSLTRTPFTGEDTRTFDKSTFFINENSALYLSFYIANGNDIPKAIDLWEEVEGLMSKYYPTRESEYFDGDKEVSIYSTNHVLLYENKLGELEVAWHIDDFEGVENLVAYQYVDNIEQGRIEDDGTTWFDTRPKYINTLYINDKLYESNSYNIEFIYNPIDDEYYTKVCFTSNVDSNTKRDFLMQEIIYKTYHNKLKWEDESVSSKTTYKIDQDDFEILWKEANNSFVFKKNGAVLGIEHYRKICGELTDAYPIQYIVLDDFAKLMEMWVEKIDVKNDAIYLKTN